MRPALLQRVVVRMLYDPAVVEAVYAGRPVDGLDADGRRMLVAVDRRAWGTDPFRRSRTLHALIEEYPATALIAGISALDAFFSSSGFHRCVMARGAVALAFGAWLAPLGCGVAALELGLARARRPTRHPPGDGLVLAPGVEPVSVPDGTLAHLTALRAQLGPDPVAALLAGARRPTTRPPDGPATEHLLLERGADGDIAIGGASPSLTALCAFARRPRTRAAVIREARAQGADRGADEEIVDSLIEDGLLVAADAR